MTDLGIEERAEVEARARKEGAVNEQLRQHDVRLTANHDSLANLRSVVAGHDTAINVIATEVKETRIDVNTMSGKLEMLSRNFFAAAASMAALTLAVVGLIVSHH